jgi:hypothetical protein
MPLEHDIIYIGDDHKQHGNDMPGFRMVGASRAVCVGAKLPKIVGGIVGSSSGVRGSSGVSGGGASGGLATASDARSGKVNDSTGSWLVLKGVKVAGVPMYDGGPAAVRDVIHRCERI